MSSDDERKVADLHGSGEHRLSPADPLADANWNRVLADFSEATVFHTREWAQVLNDTYGHKPHYFTIGSDRARQALCVFEIDSWLTGRRAVSLPFSDECPVLGIEDSTQFQKVLEELGELGRARDWKTIEVRGAPVDYKGTRSDEYYTHELNLGPGVGRLFSNFDGSVRRAVRKAERAGVHAEVRTDRAAIEEYFELHCLTRRKHGVPPQPLKFFQNIHRHLIARGIGFTVLARRNGQVLAGAVFLHFRGRGLYKFGASNPAMDPLRPSNLVMWQGIQNLCAAGIQSLSFGRTSLNQDGLRRYKLGWGTREREISYVRFNVANRSYASQTGSAHANWLFGKLPIPLLKRVGALLYPHIG